MTTDRQMPPRDGETSSGYARRPDQRLRIEGWIVDPSTNQISQAGETVRLEPKVMDLLLYLADRPGVVVSRADIEADVWEGLVLSYDTVTGAVAKLRKALGDNARQSHLIETISKKGYRLLVPVEQLDEQREAPHARDGGVGRRDSRTAWLRRGAGALLLVCLIVALSWAGLGYWKKPEGASAAMAKPIAVLPFENFSNDPEQEYFADGITEDLITDLSKVSGLFVIARDSTFAFKDTGTDLREVARQLGVRYLLEGSVRRSGGKMRINVQLVDGETGGRLWAERYDGELADVFKLQDEVAREVVAALAVNLTSDEEKRLSRAGEIDPEAYDLFLQGRTLVRLYSPQANAEARDYFERAIAIDPAFARAHAGMALSYAVDITFGWSTDPERARSQVAAHIRKALAYGSDTPQIHFTQAMIYGSERRMDEAIGELREAVSLDPNFADAQTTLGLFLAYAGRPAEAIDAIQTAMRLSPHHGYIYPYHLATAYFVMKRYDEALPILEEVLQRNQNFQQGRLLLISTLGLMGRTVDAEWEVDEVMTAMPDFSLTAEEARVRFVQPEDRARYIDGLRVAGLPE